MTRRGNDTGMHRAVCASIDAINRIYLNPARLVEVQDPVLGRTHRVDKTGSAAPWYGTVARSRPKSLPDFEDEKYLAMICVQSGNLGDEAVMFPPGSATAM